MGQQPDAIAGAMRRAPPWVRRAPRRGGAGCRHGLCAGVSRHAAPRKDVARGPAPSSARARSKARKRGAVASAPVGRASLPAMEAERRAGTPAPLKPPAASSAPCPVCISPMRRRIELRLFQGAAAAQALRGLGPCGLSAAAVRAHFESRPLPARSRLVNRDPG